MEIHWSPEQRQVIEHRGSNLLVSAAAGSGKTAVLVERIIRMILDEDHPVDIDRLLVVTFTNAAAAEMRERISAAIEHALREAPDSFHLQRQQTLIHNAKIMTMHSFCLYVIRNQFHRIDLEPGFRIADEVEIRLLQEDVLKQVLNDYYGGVYEKELHMEQFLAFAECYAPGKNDQALREMILNLYEYAMSYPWPGEWLMHAVDVYKCADADSDWMRELTDYLNIRLEDIHMQLEEALDLCREADGPFMYEDTVASEVSQWRKQKGCETFADLYHWQKGLVFGRLKAARGYEGSAAKQQAVKDIRDQAKKELADFRRLFFYEEPEAQLEHLHQAAVHVETLVSLTLKFMQVFEQKKREKNLLDFHDQEHLALQILIDSGTKEPTEVAKEYQQQFVEIMVDEYQDSNHVQETLVQAVSRDHRNIFMVGDVKQSIYRFRLARPELFIEKYDSYKQGTCEIEEEKEPELSDGCRIDLHQNFRSREQVTGFINDIFAGIMGRDLGNVEYDEKAALYPGADYPEGQYEDYQPELILVEEEDAKEDKLVLEARAAAQKIREMVGNVPVLDKKTGELRLAGYGDVVILLRSLSRRAEVFLEVFAQEGIPLLTPSQTGYFAALEVRTILSMLRVIDNPMQDIPLAAVLKSPIVGMTSEELALVRAAHPSGSFYDAVVQEVENHSKLKQFWEQLQSFRDRVPYTPIHTLLEQIYEETGYLNYVSVMPAGQQRRANLQMLLEKAVAYEKTSYRGLFHFMRYMDQLHKYEVDFGEAEGLEGAPDAVHMMTIHKSKGLEFPVVLLCGMSKLFNRQDETKAMVLHPEYGIGLDLIDPNRRVKTPLLLKQAFRQMTRQENLGEELRVLYVAMTRAKEKLVLMGEWDENRIQQRSEQNRKRRLSGRKRLSFGERYNVRCYLDWVLPMMPEDLKIEKVTPESQVKKEAAEVLTGAEYRARAEALIAACDPAAVEQVGKRFSWEYDYSEEASARQKVSVSELKHRAMEQLARLQEEDAMEDTRYFYEKPPMVPYLPKFEHRVDEINQGALRGTATHRFMECLDFTKAQEYSVTEWIDLFVQKGQMSEAQAELIVMDKAERFLNHPVMQRMKAAAEAGALYKERPFVMGRPANELGMPGDELVLVQGIIDVFWKEDDGIVLLDYKTDAVRTEKELVDRYRTQLELYQKAVEQALHEPVKEVLIYSFALGSVIKL